jgi:hypothetical protein
MPLASSFLKGLEVLHVETDVVEDAPFGGRLRRVGLVEAQLRYGEHQAATQGDCYMQKSP